MIVKHGYSEPPDTWDIDLKSHPKFCLHNAELQARKPPVLFFAFGMERSPDLPWRLYITSKKIINGNLEYSNRV